MSKKYTMQVKLYIDLEVKANSFAEVEEKSNRAAFDFSQEMKGSLDTKHDVNDWELVCILLQE